MSYGSEAAALNALLSIFAGFWLVILAFFVLNIVAGWKIFEKAGQPGWWSHTRILTPTDSNVSRHPELQTAYTSSMPTVLSIEKMPQSAMSSIC